MPEETETDVGTEEARVLGLDKVGKDAIGQDDIGKDVIGKDQVGVVTEE